MKGNEGLQVLPTVQLQHISVGESAEPRRDQVRGFLYKFTVTNCLSMETYFHGDKEWEKKKKKKNVSRPVTMLQSPPRS